MDKVLVDKIRDSYGISGELTAVKRIDGYPHIIMLSFGDEEYVVKKVQKIYCKSIDTLYNYLSHSSYVELPLKTVDNSYGLMINGNLFITYPLRQKKKGRIQSFWWAKALWNIHNINVNPDDFCGEYSITEESFSLFNSAKKFFSDDLNRCVVQLLDKYYKECEVKKLVLSHADPYDDNVMINRSYIKLIDTDGARLLPKEFDIQRLFHNEVNVENDLNEIDKYINIFLCNYGSNIDLDVLRELYVMDLLRSLSWLFLVTRDKTRADNERQLEELARFEESILSGRHQNVLKRL